MSKHKFVHEADMKDGMPALGVVYYILHEAAINKAWRRSNVTEPPQVIGYIVIEKEEGEDNETET